MMNDGDFDRLLTDALAWRADQHIAKQTPRRLAIRQLGVRLTSPSVEVRSKLFDTSGRAGARRGSRLIGQIAGVAAVVVVAALVVSYVFGPASQFGSTGPLFTSERHSYSLRLPNDGWTVTEYPGEWHLGDFLNAESPGSDYFARAPAAPPETLVYMWMSSQAIPDEMTFDGWLYVQDGVTAASAECFDLQGAYEQIDVDGETARVGLYFCPDFAGSGNAWATVQVLFSRDHRGYAMYFWPEQGPDMAPDEDVRRAALSWLSSFSFTDLAGPTPTP